MTENPALCKKCMCLIPVGYLHDCRIRFFKKPDKTSYRNQLRKAIEYLDEVIDGASEPMTKDDVLDIYAALKGVTKRNYGKVFVQPKKATDLPSLKEKIYPEESHDSGW